MPISHIILSQTGFSFVLLISDGTNNICHILPNIVGLGTFQVFLPILDNQQIYKSFLIINLAKKMLLHYILILVPYGNQDLMANFLKKIVAWFG